VWHDLWWRWVAWALLNCVFFSLEIVFLHIVRLKFLGTLQKLWYYRLIAAAAGAFDIVLLMVANLAILYGFDQTPEFLTRAFFSDGGYTAGVCLSFLGIGVLLMQDIRAIELQKHQVKRF